MSETLHKHRVAAKAAEEPAFDTFGVATMAAAHSLHDSFGSFLPPLLSVFIANLGLTKADAGLLSVFQQMPSLLQPFIGHLSDRVNLRFLVVLAPIVTAACMSSLPVAPNYFSLAALLVLAGISSAGFHSVAPALAASIAGSKVGRGMSFWMVGGETGRSIGPILVVFALTRLGAHRTPLLMLLGFAGSAVLHVALRNVHFQPTQRIEGETIGQVLRKMAPLLVPMSGILIVHSFMSAALTTFLPTFLTEKGASLWFASISLSLLQTAGIGGSFLGGWMSDQVERRNIVLFSLATTPWLMLGFMLIGGPMRFVMLVLLGFVMFFFLPVNQAIMLENFPENRAMANGLYLAQSFVLRSLITVFLGAVADHWSLSTAFYISAVLPLAGIPLVFSLPKNK